MIDLPRFSNAIPAGTSAVDRASRVSQNLSKDGRDDPDSRLEAQTLEQAREPLSSQNETGRRAVQEVQELERTRVERRQERQQRLEDNLSDQSSGTSLGNERAQETQRLENESRERQEEFLAARTQTDDGRSTGEVGSNRYERKDFVAEFQERAAGENVSSASELVREQQVANANTREALRGSKVQSVGEFIVERQVQSRGSTLALSSDQAESRQVSLDRLEAAFKGGAEDIVGVNVSVKA